MSPVDMIELNTRPAPSSRPCEIADDVSRMAAGAIGSMVPIRLSGDAFSQTVDIGIPGSCPDIGRWVATSASRNPILKPLSRLRGR